MKFTFMTQNNGVTTVIDSKFMHSCILAIKIHAAMIYLALIVNSFMLIHRPIY